MQESHRKGVAIHPDPKSCMASREAAIEALTGAHVGRVLSCEIIAIGVPTSFSKAEGHTDGSAIASLRPTPRSLRPAHAWKLHAREPGDPIDTRGRGLVAGRSEKAMRRTSDTHVGGESDGRVLPTKCPNNDGAPSAEGMEGRRPTKENTEQTTAPRTQSRTRASSGLLGVRQVARKDKRIQFTALLHHATVALLWDSFYALKRDAAPGVDAVTWKDYETDLDARLRDLHSRVHTGTYRAQPSKRAYIPKADGRRRPLGIAAVEDKIVQHAVVTILNQIYEQDFVGFSYGFRPKRSQHHALDALWVGIMRKHVNWVLDADIRGF